MLQPPIGWDDVVVVVFVIMMMMMIIITTEGQTLGSSFLLRVCKATGHKEEGQPLGLPGSSGFWKHIVLK